MDTTPNYFNNESPVPNHFDNKENITMNNTLTLGELEDGAIATEPTTLEKALAFMKDIREVIKKHPDIYSLVINMMPRDEGQELWLELDVLHGTLDDDGYGDVEIDTPLHIEVSPGKCTNLYDHSIDYIIERMERDLANGHKWYSSIEDPWEAEDAEKQDKPEDA